MYAKSVISVCAVLGMLVSVCNAQEFRTPEKSHGSRLLTGAADAGVRGTVLTASYVHYATVDEDGFDNPYGVSLGYQKWSSGQLGAQITVGYENWDTEDSAFDTTLVPIGLSLLLSPMSPDGDYPVYFDVGLAYGIIDSDGMDLDDAVLGRIGVTAEFRGTSEMSFGASLRYQFDLVEAEYHIGDSTGNISLAGLIVAINLGLAW